MMSEMGLLPKALTNDGGFSNTVATWFNMAKTIFKWAAEYKEVK